MHSSYWASFMQKYYSYREPHYENEITLWKKITHLVSWRDRQSDRQTCKLSENAGIINVGLWMECSSLTHYSNVIMSMIASQIISILIIFSTICSGADQRKHQSSVSLAFVRGIQWSPVDSPHKGPVTRKVFPFDHVIMKSVNSINVIDNSSTILWAAHVQRRNTTGYTESIVEKA